MIRPFTLLCGLFAAGSMLYLYQSKHQAQMLDRDIAHTLKAADDVKGRIGILRAEYQMLNDPARLQELAEKHLALRPTAPTQFTTLADISRRLPAIELAPAEPPPEPPETELFELPPVPPPAPAVVATPAPVVAAPKPAAAPPPPRPAPPPVVASAPPVAAKPTVLATAPTPLRPAAQPVQSPAPVVTARPAPTAIAATPLAPPTHTVAVAAPMSPPGPQATQRPQLQQVSAMRPVPDVPRPAFTSALGMARSRPAPSSVPNFDGPAR